jgi:cell division septation protein DedD
MSEIFDNYAKIAIQNGLIKVSAEDKPKEKPKKINETNPRFDSLSIEDIANLYGKKPDMPEDMKYERNIIEDAHPERVVMFRSHDKVNSLVENDQERQNIIINMIRKMPNGNLANKKYAESELALSLVRLAIDMDNKNKDEFRVLADTCMKQLQKEAQGATSDWSEGLWDTVKDKASDAVDVGGGALSGLGVGAVAGGLIGAIGGPAGIWAGMQIGSMAGPLVAGVLSAIFKTSPQAKSVALNAQLALDQLKDLIKDDPTNAFLKELQTALLHIIPTASNYSKVVDKMHMPGANESDRQAAATTGTVYLDELTKLSSMIKIFTDNARRGEYAPKESDWWSKIKSPFVSIFGDDVNDEVKALAVLEKVIEAAETGIAEVQAEVSNLPKTPTTPTPAPVAATTPAATAPATPATTKPPMTPEQIREMTEAINNSEKETMSKQNS